MLHYKVVERELRRWKFLAGVDRLHEAVQEVFNVGLGAVEVAFIRQLDGLCFVPSVLVGVAGIITTKEGGASFDDLASLFTRHPITTQQFCKVHAE